MALEPSRMPQGHSQPVGRHDHPSDPKPAAFAATRLSPGVRVELSFFDRLSDLHNHFKEIINNHLKDIGKK